VLFFAGERLYASSIQAGAEGEAAKTLAANNFGAEAVDRPLELAIAGESQLAFARPLTDIEGRRVGFVVVLHSLAAAGRLFRAISNRLAVVGAMSITLILLLSYFLARRITKPIESLVVGTRKLGEGHYEVPFHQESGGEIGLLAAAFEQMRQSLIQGQAVLLRNERLATIGRMASGIIHDLRTPLAAISTAAELFSSADLTAEQRAVLARSQIRSSQRMGLMLKEMLEFSRGKYELKAEPQRLAPLLESVVRDLITSDSAPGVKVEMHIPAKLFIRADADRIRRLFENLLVNSIQAMPAGGAITLSAVASGRVVRINIADSGSGIPEQLRDKLFEPFVETGKKGGTGLGLAIASGIAEAHGGSLKLVSEADQPADFCIELPLLSEA
jgi:signal transduction histidine kinase